MNVTQEKIMGGGGVGTLNHPYPGREIYPGDLPYCNREDGELASSILCKIGPKSGINP